MTIDFEPENEDEVASIIRAAAERSARLAILGGGTRGFGIAGADAVLSTRRLSGIVTYNPAEMTMSALAGTSVAEIEATLAERPQMLAFEPMDPRALLGSTGEPTIGGVFAANVSGPRRLSAGAARDHLLGIRFVNGEGVAIKSGGRVMKNVTGLDLVKFLAGSHGTLGLLTEVTFKVLPLPPSAATIVLSGLNDAEAAGAMARVMAMPYEVSSAAHLPESVRGRFLGGNLPEGPATVLRLEGLSATVSARAEKLAQACSVAGPVTVLGDEDTRMLWREIRDVKPYADGTDRPIWNVSVAPTTGHQLVAALRLETGVDAFYDWQGGRVWLRMEADPEAGLLRRFIKALGGGHARLVRASASVRAATPVFEPEAPAVAALSQRLREKFDPQGIFNPGLMG
ncbi:glycolate oxidase FAD binding subunit [Pararhizobium capsulatum DSM 1112]|uniref:Glycolate oxidase FAD binding subunit n=1 Tax=Pararhizobium capsulatum DSM 1112 TaxID=1121113 RepID=A0ABU0BM16_9HYPH|nr:FAD-binding protein [Pararhizobium capsulatum]MDQ0319290.1 glycolate oxidase FAD binding subunit [Pararhizobium capsulatum DSM 1112]